MLKSVVNHRYVLWALLALPAIPMFAALIGGSVDDEGRAPAEFLLHPTGEFAARFMIIAMALTPLRMLFPQSHAIRWLIARRRYFGVAAFSYAALHTVLYIVDMRALEPILAEFTALGIWPGWLAMLLFVPLALTSNEASVRALGASWKSLQRLVYPAAVATLVHWIFVHNNLGAALAHFIPLAALETYRIWRNATRSLAKEPAT